jgi:hypothetical protein
LLLIRSSSRRIGCFLCTQVRLSNAGVAPLVASAARTPEGTAERAGKDEHVSEGQVGAGNGIHFRHRSGRGARAGAEGADVTLNGFGDAGEIERLRQEIETASGVRTFFSGADLTRPDAVAAMMSEAADALGPIDILVNNAGTQHVSPVEDFPPEKWDLLIALNLSAVFHTTRLALPR